MRHVTLLSATTALTLLVGANPAYAQENVAAEAPQAAPGVGEIIVTAQRRAESLQNVPISVTAVTSEQLQTRRLNDLVAIQNVATSFQTTNDNNFVIRGIGAAIFKPQIDSSVGVSVDDVALGVPLFMSNGIFNDVARVEVLSGPQGLLFGRNASAGLLQIISNRPELNKLSGDVGVEYDNRDTAPGGHFGLVTRGTINVPVSQNSALRINVGYSTQDPLTRAGINTSSDAQLKQTRLGGKVKYLWEPHDGLNVYLIGDYSRERGSGGTWDYSYRFADEGTYALEATSKDGCTPGKSNFCNGLSAPQYRSVNTGGVSLNVSAEINPVFTLTNIAAWRHYTLHFNLDADYSSSVITDVNRADSTYNQYSDELRLGIKAGDLDGQVGLYAFKSILNEQTLLQSNVPIPGIIGGDSDSRNTLRSLAAFGLLNYHIGELTLSAGARLTNDHVTVNTSESQGGYVVATTGPAGTFAFARSNTNFSYRIGAQYQIRHDVMAYLNFSTGYKGPSYPGTLTADPSKPAGVLDPYIKPETVDNVEGGLKATFFDNKLRLNVSGFYEKFKNYQVQTFTEQGISYIGNAGGVRAYGVEINGAAKPTKRLTINYGATFLNSKFTDFLTACYLGQSADTCNMGTPGNQFFQAAGTTTPNAPKFTSTIQGMYDIYFGADTLTLEANWYHRSSQNYSASGAPFAQIGAANLLGASITYKLGEQADISVFCRNCTDKHIPGYIAYDPPDAILNGKLAVTNTWNYNSVRTIGAAVNFRF